VSGGVLNCVHSLPLFHCWCGSCVICCSLLASFMCVLHCIWQFAHWLDAVLLVFSLDSELSFSEVYSNYTCLYRFRDMREIPIVMVGTQDTISEKSPRSIDDFHIRRMVADLHNCTFHETCAMYGLNIDRVFLDGGTFFLMRCCCVVACLISMEEPRRCLILLACVV